jgi:hypothetical protein
MGPQARYLAHLKIARQKFHQMNILDVHVFDLVDWEMVHKTLHNVPKLFQQWACEQVMGIVGTMAWDKTECKKCPSCMQVLDTCAHVLFCDHAGRVKTLKHTIDLLEQWLGKGDTEPDLLDCIAEYTYSWGRHTMANICHGLGDNFQKMARDQNTIGWQRFMEGMIGRRMHGIQNLHHLREVTHLSPKRWAQGLILKLLEATHGQWIYRNIQIHDSVAGTQTTLWKEAIQQEI